jgi:hypothetical protein
MTLVIVCIHFIHHIQVSMEATLSHRRVRATSRRHCHGDVHQEGMRHRPLARLR